MMSHEWKQLADQSNNADVGKDTWVREAVFGFLGHKTQTNQGKRLLTTVLLMLVGVVLDQQFGFWDGGENEGVAVVVCCFTKVLSVVPGPTSKNIRSCCKSSLTPAEN